MAAPASSWIIEDRLMMSRINTSAITVTMVVPHGVKSYGCCACCYAPASLPACSALPCVMDPEYIVKEMEASKYIYVRENSLEWNAPIMTQSEGNCFGVSCCYFRAQDHVTVIYFDDPMFDRITDKTPCCNQCATWCCGGEGELIQIDSKFCFGCCYRSVLGAGACVPVCCAASCCPCYPLVIKHKIWVANAADAKAGILEARDNARERMGLKK
ncbi:hypothetical protein TeGR_g5513 [Tetraparma gracilis]|uniref:Phospholipid scramblase n=1 Tax=Tetraparma gracilis TaxID=2962635 RepID=A0ABQ6MHC4_9STRA|nr:hypothetical protein TeGR_g5513 [Tetraparma gracilis]